VSFRRDKALQAAQQHAARGDLGAAIREYQSVVEHDPGDVQTWLMLADSLHRAGNLDAAVDRYVHAANVLFEMGEIPNALQVYRQVLNLAPERYDVHMRTGQAFESLRRYPEAVALYEKVAGVYLRSGNTREALMLYERVADLMPREIAKRLRLAELFSRERRVDEAVQHFQMGADFLREAGRSKEFVRVAERLLYHRPVDSVARDLVRVYLELGQPRRALMKLNELLQRKNDDPEGLELLAETFVRLGNINKACMVVLELVRHQREAGSMGTQLCVRVLRKAIGWAPNNAKLKQALEEIGGAAEVAAAPTLEVVEEFEELEEIEEFEELEEIEEIEEAPEPGPPTTPPAGPPATPSTDQAAGPPTGEVPAPRRHSLTEEVISEGAQRGGEDSGETELDLDKQLEEVRVLLKYHLFEHALSHVEKILALSPELPAGLELSAEILAALGRNQEAADSRAALAQQLIDRDPSAAARHVELALALIPDHPLASEIGERLSEISGVDVGVADVEEAAPPSDDPLGALDLDDDLLGPIEASDSLIGRVDPSLAEEIGADTDHVEFPGEDADPLAGLELDEVSETIDIRDADPSLHGELNRLGDDDDFAISLDSETEPEEEEEEIGFEDRFGLGGDDEDATDDVAAGEQAAAGQPMVGRVEPDTDAGPRDEASPFGLPEDEAAAEPETAAEDEAAAEEDWPDLSAELDELEFYLAQDLEEDARAAYDDLVELFPGHPELAKIAHRFPDAAGVEVDAAAPLLDLEDEDEDEDDFLANIFADEAPKQRKKREVAIQTHEVGDADASDHFDLGTAYREMGLFDKAFAEYELASSDPRWQAKALVMMGTLRVQSGDAETAVELFERAVAAARTKDERCEANYELAMVRLATGDVDGAKAAFEVVEPGYRDRDAKLAELN
jgi:pilus assembly protein FimV